MSMPRTQRTDAFLCRVGAAAPVRPGGRATAEGGLPQERGTAAGVTWRGDPARLRAGTLRSALRLTLQDPAGDPTEVIWDAPRRVLTLRRGLWSRPLYYAAHDGGVLVADSLRLLAASLSTPPTPDWAALDAFLALEVFPAPLTPFREIRKVGVEAACVLDVTGGTRRETTLPLPRRRTAVTPEPDGDALGRAADELWAALVAVVQDGAAHDQGEPAVLCSGGLESTLIAHALRGHGRAVVLSYHGTWKDEAPRARRAAAAAGLPLAVVTPPPFAAADLTAYVALLDEPLGSTSGYAFARRFAALPDATAVYSGAGACLLSLINDNHRHLETALACGDGGAIMAELSRRATFMAPAARRDLLPANAAAGGDPVAALAAAELLAQGSLPAALLAAVRRQLCAEAELTPLWALAAEHGSVPVLPFFAPRVRELMDQASVPLLRDARFRRRLLESVATRHCPEYTPPPRQLGGGLPLGEPGYPDAAQLRAALAAQSGGPLRRAGLERLAGACETPDPAARFHALRRLWTALVLQIWLSQTLPTNA